MNYISRTSLIAAIRKLSVFVLAAVLITGMSFLFESQPARADYFNCFDANNCTPPALSNSDICLPGRDYEITISDLGSEVTVLSFHGGRAD